LEKDGTGWGAEEGNDDHYINCLTWIET